MIAILSDRTIFPGHVQVNNMVIGCMGYINIFFRYNVHVDTLKCLQHLEVKVVRLGRSRFSENATPFPRISFRVSRESEMPRKVCGCIGHLLDRIASLVRSSGCSEVHHVLRSCP